MPLQPLPFSPADATVEALLAERATPGAGVHRTAVALLLLALPALPLARVPVAVQSPGAIRPSAEQVVLRAPQGGLVHGIYARTGEPVRVGGAVVGIHPVGALPDASSPPGGRADGDAQGQVQAPRAETEVARVRSPVAGLVERLGAVLPGSYVSAGDPLAVIAPNADLFAEVYVTPRQIGRLRTGAPVRVRVDAFDWHHWGHVEGHVAGIPSDVSAVRGRMVFAVRVALERDHLSLPDGTRAYLRSGMAVQAHFVAPERTLWQLLRGGGSSQAGPRAH